MTLAACVVFLLIKTSIAESSHFLDYPLRVVEYLKNQHVRTFECIFIDTSSQNPYGNVLSVLLQSSKLEYVVKYVTQGFSKSDLLPKDPSLLVLHPGRDDDLRSKGVVSNFLHFLNRFNPVTTVFVFLDFSQSYAISLMRFVLVNLNINSVLFFNTKDSAVIASSLTDYTVVEDDLPHPKYLFDWFKRELRGKNISYVREPRSGNDNPNFKWLMATVEYLKGEAREFHKQEGGPKAADVQLEVNIAYGVPEHFQCFFVTAPQVGRILVPRGRALNAVEIMVMPFDWKVWVLLLMLLVLAEVVKNFLPELFKNDPILLVVFGFGRYNLHRAGRWEKIILQSLIILMFFMTNAFETKIVSLMVDKPSAQNVKSLEDFDRYGLKFRYNLNEFPEVKDHPVIGKYIDNGEHIEIWENIPGFAKYVTQQMADLVPRFSYDFERDQSWFVVLDESFFVDAILVHLTAFRSQYVETFHFTERTLNEAGILNYWWRQSGDSYWLGAWGIRPKGKIGDEGFLVFEDMLLAWIILGTGYGISTVAFISEVTIRKKKNV